MKFHKSNIFLLVFFVLFPVLSCKQERQERISWPITIDAPYDGSDAHKQFNSLFRLAGYTALETNDESLIGRIAKAVFYNNEIFILERGNSIIRFSKDGRHLHTYTHFGEGPAEYVGMEDFDIKNDTIHILDVLKRKVIMYTLNDEFCGTRDVPFGEAFRVLDNGIALYKGTGYGDASDQDHMGYAYIDARGEHTQIPQNPYLTGYGMIKPVGKNKFFGFHGLTYLTFTFDNKIYQIDPDTGEATLKYVIDNGIDFAITPEMDEQETKKRKKLAFGPGADGLYQLYAYPDLLFMTYEHNKSRNYIAFTPEGEIVLNGALWHDTNGLAIYTFMQYDSPDNCETRLITSLTTGINYFDDSYKPNDLAKEIISHITDDSNPVLVYYERINENF